MNNFNSGEIKLLIDALENYEEHLLEERGSVELFVHGVGVEIEQARELLAKLRACKAAQS